MQTMLATIVTWLSVNLGLPAIHELPSIEFVSPEMMQIARRRATELGEAPSLRTDKPAQPGRDPEVEAFYDDARQTIYLPKSWTSESPADLSVLVHEMVHHVQNVAGLKYPCPEAREKPAYAAQKKWLAQSGRDLMDEFDLDPMTVLVRTNCMH